MIDCWCCFCISSNNLREESQLYSHHWSLTPLYPDTWADLPSAAKLSTIRMIKNVFAYSFRQGYVLKNFLKVVFVDNVQFLGVRLLHPIFLITSNYQTSNSLFCQGSRNTWSMYIGQLASTLSRYKHKHYYKQKRHRWGVGIYKR